MATKAYLGQTLKGIINLRTIDPTTGAVNPYVIQSGAVIQLKFPGAGAGPGLQGTSVVLSTANSGEITIVSSTASQITFSMSPTKSNLLFVTTSAAVDCIITNTDGSEDIFEAASVYNIQAIKNP
jgi:hypothetical protein